jgi:O-antigen ligase
VSARQADRLRELAIVLVALPLVAAAGMESTTLGTRYGLGKLVWVLLAGVAAMFAATRPRHSLPLLLITIAFIFRTKKLLGADVRISQGVEAVIIGQLVMGLYAGRVRVPRGLIAPVSLIGLGGIVAAVAGPDLGGSMFRWATVLAPALLLCVAVATTIDLERDLPLIVTSVAIALAGTGVLGLYQHAGGTIPGSAFSGDRISGLFNHPNDLGDFVAVTILLLLGVAANAWRRYPASPVFLLVPIGLGLPTLAFTLSRGALIGLVAGVAVILVLCAFDRQIAPLLVALLLVVGIIAVAIPTVPSKQRTEFVNRLQHSSLSQQDFGRKAIYHVAEQTIRDYPVTGVGPLAFGGIMLHSSQSPSFQGGAITAHNIYFEGYLSVGPLGLLGFAWLIAAAVRRLWRLRPSIGGPGGSLISGWAIGSLGALACLAVHGIVDFVFWQQELLMLYFVIIGLAFAIRRPEG